MEKMLTGTLIGDKAFWQGKDNCVLPGYDRENTPITAICFSPGRMGYGHFGDILQDIMDKGGKAGLVCGVESFSQPYYNGLVANDFLCTHVIYGEGKGEVTLKIQGAFKTALFVDADTKSLPWTRLLDFARDEKVTYATINAPEAVYGMRYFEGDYAEPSAQRVIDDMQNGTVNSDPAKWTYFLRERFIAGLKFSMVSCTNFSRNGFFTAAVIRTIARAWEQNGFAPQGFEAYVADRSRVGFPNTMVDRIAVSPDAKVFADLAAADLLSPVVVTEKNRYWCIEDCFPAGRPEFEKAEGVFMCRDFEEVKKYEDMKLRILNMSHTTIAGLGSLMGFRGEYQIYAAMQNAEIVGIIKDVIGLVTGIIERPAGIAVEDFAADTFTRLNNQNIPDDPLRIALGCSTKIHPRLMETYWEAKEKGFGADKLASVLRSVAGVLCYTTGRDFAGNTFTLADDPIGETLKKCGQDALAGKPAKDAFEPLLRDKAVMGRDLFDEPDTLDALIAQIDALLARLK